MNTKKLRISASKTHFLLHFYYPLLWIEIKL